MWIKNDGGRAAAGYKGEANDCVCRAFAIATGKPYIEIYKLINEYGKKHGGRSSARNGVDKRDVRIIADQLGFDWFPVMRIGTGCTMHLKDDELPMGTIVASCSGHVVAVIDGDIYDTYDSSNNGTRCVYGYWMKREDA